MSINNDIANMLNLKEENLLFEENCTEYRTVKDGVQALFVKAKLTYEPKCCTKCGVIKDNKIIKHGFKESKITLPKMGNRIAYLLLKKQRYICEHCNSTFTVSTNIVDKNCYISNNTKHSIAVEASKKISEKDLASYFNVSHSTVNKLIYSYYTSLKVNKKYLPSTLCFDEFKSTKSAEGAMSFIFCNEKGDIVDILEDRRLPTLIKYFMSFTKKARNMVNNIVIDMYAPYISLIKKIFPHANIVIDKFHVINHISRALNKTRIGVMNSNKEFYNKYKRYWKLLLKDRSKLLDAEFKSYRCFKERMREVDIVDFLLSINEELKNSYELYQQIYFSISSKNEGLLKKAFNTDLSNVSKHMKKAVTTLKKYDTYILNTIKTNYTNGVLEGINNLIKTFKRIAFGYRSFYHLKARVLMYRGMIKLKKSAL